jgi:hypothetical protein
MKTNYFLIARILLAALLLAGCSARPRVGALQSESQSVELGNTTSVRAEIDMGAGNLELTGGADKLLEADFTYNVAELKPEVENTDGTLVVRQPVVSGMPDLRDITDYRNEWDLSLSNKVPMDLKVDMGAGSGELQLAGLSLTGLDVTMGAGTYTIDLSGGWAQDLDVTIDAGAANLTVRLPRDVGARVQVESGPHITDATGMTKNGDVYTNDAFGVADVTMHVYLTAGIGFIYLDVEK